MSLGNLDPLDRAQRGRNPAVLPDRFPSYPQGPKAYEVGAGKGKVKVVVSSENAGTSDPTGTVNITAFDGHHLAGVVDVSTQIVFSPQKIRATVAFDLPCTDRPDCK